MENDGFLLMVEEEETLELWDSCSDLTGWLWRSNLPLQFSLLTEALRLWPVFPGLLELILTRITVELGQCRLSSVTCRLGRTRG